MYRHSLKHLNAIIEFLILAINYNAITLLQIAD